MPPIRFGEFEFDEQTLELRKGGVPVRIQQQPARVLGFLLHHRGSLVAREQIRLAIWGDDTFVDFEQGLNFCIRQIRLALNDRAEQPRFVETLPRLGYRFVGQIETDSADQAAPAQKRVRIAVIPIEDLSGHTEDYFAAGLTEDMISALSRIDPQRLRVTAGPKGMGGADSSPEGLEQLRRALDADFLLRGTVRRSGERMRIGAQLHDLIDKSVLWSETYDFQSWDLLAIQEEVTQRVSRSLALGVFPSATVGSRRYARSAAAYDAYLKGRFFWHKMTIEAIARSMAYFQEALSLDSGFAPAHAGIADCYAQMGSVRVGQMKPLDALANSRTYLKKALDLDETLAEAHCTLGLLKSWYEWDWNGAEREFQLSLELDSSLTTALIWQSLLYAAVGRSQDAIASMRRARELEPLSPSVHLYLGMAHSWAGHHDLAIRQIQQSIELDPGSYRAYMFLGKFLSVLERHEEALAALNRALLLFPGHLEAIAFLGSALAGKGDRNDALKTVEEMKAADSRSEPAVLIASVYARLGMKDAMYEWLEQAVQVKSTPIYIGVITHDFAPYFSDPRFHRFLAAIGLSHRARA